VQHRALQPVGEARAARTRAVRVVRPEHHVVGQQLRTALEQLGKALLAVLGIEQVVLLHRNPRQLAPLPLDLLVALGLLRLDLGELVAGLLPLLAGSDLGVSQRLHLLRMHGTPVAA
jgi:hypothetical protein